VSERRVLLGVASGGRPAAPFIESLARLRLPPSIPALQRSVVTGNYVPAQRELIMRDAIDGNYDYLFFVDDDIVLPPDALELLVATAETDPATAVVGGLYYSRDSLKPIAVADWDSTGTASAHVPAFTSTSTDIVDGIGFGCALLRIAAARKLAAPYFPAHVYIESGARRARLCDEDYLYCERVRHAGNTVRLDARVRCGHYDRASDSTAPIVWEADTATSVPRMVVVENGVTRLVPLDPTAACIVENHARAELTYITVG
jgi:Glycosyl transferase family 2